MQSYHGEVIPPSGVEFATTLNLTPSTSASGPSSSSSLDGKVLTNLVTARSNWLRIYEIREEAAVLPSLVEDERRHAQANGDGTRSRRGTEAVEGEVAMDVQGEGFVNVGQLKVNAFYSSSLQYIRYLQFV
jgi:cleavage and polyadenylation specificity factor subunit 1